MTSNFRISALYHRWAQLKHPTPVGHFINGASSSQSFPWARSSALWPDAFRDPALKTKKLRTLLIITSYQRIILNFKFQAGC
jgi:hypothetical protein